MLELGMAQEGINAEQRIDVEETVTYLLENVGIEQPKIHQYDHFLLADKNDVTIVNRDIKCASLALGRLYFCSLDRNVENELKYESGEQMMLRLITGRTIREDPKPIIKAATDFSESYGQSELLAQECVALALSGIQKLRLRSDNRPASFGEAFSAFQRINKKFKLF